MPKIKRGISNAEAEKTAMTKSYKMVLLRVMLARGVDHWYKPITGAEVAPFFVNYLTEKEYRRRVDKVDMDLKKAASLIERMPMTKWSGSSKGMITFEDQVFKLNFELDKPMNSIVYEWTKEVCDFRLHWYFEKKEEKL